MAFGILAKFVLFLSFVATATGAPRSQSVNVLSNDETLSEHDISQAQTSLLKVAKRSTISADNTQGRSDTSAALQETGKLLKIATMLPAETLQVLRLVSVPLLNSTLALPENLLESVATMSLGQKTQATKEQANLLEGPAKSTDEDAAEKTSDQNPQDPQARSISGVSSGSYALTIAKHRKDFLLHKKFSLGPFSLTKIIGYGKWKGKATTPPTEVVPGTICPPGAVVPVSTSAPLPEVPTITIPSVAETTTPPIPVEELPAPVSIAPVASIQADVFQQFKPDASEQDV